MPFSRRYLNAKRMAIGSKTKGARNLSSLIRQRKVNWMRSSVPPEMARLSANAIVARRAVFRLRKSVLASAYCPR